MNGGGGVESSYLQLLRPRFRLYISCVYCYQQECMSHQSWQRSMHPSAIQIQISFVVPVIQTFAMPCSFTLFPRYEHGLWSAVGENLLPVSKAFFVYSCLIDVEVLLQAGLFILVSSLRPPLRMLCMPSHHWVIKKKC